MHLTPLVLRELRSIPTKQTQSILMYLQGFTLLKPKCISYLLQNHGDICQV